MITHLGAALLGVLEEVRRREPIFHTPGFGRTVADFERMMAPDYWEVGASGRRYSRDFILLWLGENPPVDAAAGGWQSDDHGLRRLAPDTYLLTYTLRHSPRLTRRSTIWQKTLEGCESSTTKARSSEPTRTTFHQVSLQSE